MDPGIYVNQLALIGVFHQQTCPGIASDLPYAVNYASSNEIPEVLSDGRDQGRNTPGQNVKEKGSEPAPQLVGDYTAQQCKNDLKAPTDADNQTNLFIR